MTRIELLGRLRVVHQGQVFDSFPRAKAGALLGILALRPRQQHPREVLVEALWPDHSPEVGRERLRRALHWLRQSLAGATFIESDARAIWLLQDTQTDLRELERRLDLGDPTAWGDLQGGELLPGYFEQPIQEARNQLERRIAAMPRPAPATPLVETLPLYLTPFVGRAHECAELYTLVLREDVRLVTLWGLGGVGKTRLACQVATRLSPRVCFLDLTKLKGPSTPTAILAVLADMLGRPETYGGRVHLWVEQQLAGDPLLLVLDNAEHLTKAVGAVAQRLLSSLPNLTLLVTSRRPLDVMGEVLWPVPPLSANESVALFWERARLSAPRTTIEPTIASKIAQKLDGLPIAIELAAAHLRWLTPEQLETQLLRRLAILDSSLDGSRALSTTFSQSIELLEPTEQRLFARLSLFPTSFTLEAVEAILGGSLVALERLIAHSLVVSGERLSLLECLREFAAALLTPEDTALQHHFSAYYEDLLARQLAQHWPQNHAEVMRLYRAERGNFRQALEWARDADGPLFEFLPYLWDRCQEIDDALDAIQRSLTKPMARERRWSLLGWKGHFLIGARRLDEAIAVLRGVQTELADTTSPLRLHAALVLGHAFIDQEHWDAAYQEFDAALALCDPEAVLWRSQALVGLGDALLGQGAITQAQATYEAAIASANTPESAIQAGVAHLKLARLHLKSGALEQAQQQLGLVLEIAQQNDDTNLKNEAERELASLREHPGNA